ncbi:MAG: ATP-dependent Clp protease ATP-binding subunit [Bacteroidaceae bacterium]|nr:ATP-dependent Clp protease ATP-binding subunit [Bacteroidaceae bacterium]
MINRKFSPEVTNMLTESRRVALQLANDKVTPTHLLLAIISDHNTFAYNILQELDAPINELQQHLQGGVDRKETSVQYTEDDIILDSVSGRIMKLSVLESHVAGCNSVDNVHVLLAILKDNTSAAAELLQKYNVRYVDIMEHITPEKITPTDIGAGNNQDDDDDFAYADESAHAAPTMSKHPSKASATPVLDNFGTDLTKAAEEGLLDPVIGRDTEIMRVAQILSRRKKSNPILIGEPGVGKSAIVEGLATRIVHRQVPRMLWNKRVFMLDMGSIVAGTKYRGQFEERIRSIMMELKKNPNIIIFIDEIHTIIGAGGAEGTMDAANLLKPALARGEMQCIGATTIREFKQSVEKDGGLERRFQKVMVAPTNRQETVLILKNLRKRYEEHHNVTYTDAALEACVALTERYVTDRSFPDKAIDVLDEAGARQHITNIPVSPEIEQMEKELVALKEKKVQAVKNQQFELAAEYRDQQRRKENELEQERQQWEASLNDNRSTVDEQQIAEVVSVMTGIPVQRVGQQESQRLRQMRDHLQQQVVGQDEAIDCLVKAIQRSRVGLKDPNKPTGVFLFVGPTGVGKTYLTKKLAEELFGTSDALIRLDMSEYMEKHTASRMVGAPPGYVGYEEGGQLTEQVRRKPYSIVLLDEIEKAHKDVFNMLLQVMDEGRLTDGNGTTIDFRNTVVIMTSNSGTNNLKEFGRGVGFQPVAGNDKKWARSIIEKSLQKQFMPEFLNRLDEIVYFESLSPDDMGRIVDIELAPLQQRITDLGLTLTISDEAKQFIAKNGYDAQYGARPLKRAIQTLIEDPICQMIVEQDIASLSELRAEIKEEKLVITK